MVMGISHALTGIYTKKSKTKKSKLLTIVFFKFYFKMGYSVHAAKNFDWLTNKWHTEKRAQKRNNKDMENWQSTAYKVTLTWCQQYLKSLCKLNFASANTTHKFGKNPSINIPGNLLRKHLTWWGVGGCIILKIWGRGPAGGISEGGFTGICISMEIYIGGASES